MLHRRIGLCGGRTSSADAALQTAGEAAYGQPTGLQPVLPEQVQSEKSQGVRGTESPDFFDSNQREPRIPCRFSSGEVEPLEFGCGFAALRSSASSA
jgi:hypothetical protein